jgi:acyl carrier protein
MAEIEETVNELLVNEFKIEASAIDPAKTFKEIGLDSLDVVSFVMALEDRLGIEIPEKEIQHVERLGEAIELLEQKVGSRA